MELILCQDKQINVINELGNVSFQYLKIKEFRNYKYLILFYIILYIMFQDIAPSAPPPSALPAPSAAWLNIQRLNSIAPPPSALPAPPTAWLNIQRLNIQPKYYQTNIIDPTIKVFSLSDIHGDIQSFVIALRDLAGVIKKKDIPGYIFDQSEYDSNMEEILNLDLNKDEDKYIHDLNYEWCVENTHVVICGDMIDPQRTNYCLKKMILPCAYYPQIELKILMFINALNKQAKTSSSRIVKLLGNHELGGIIFPLAYKKYIYDKDIKLENEYYKGKNRKEIFQVGNYGFNLLFEDDCGILIKINKTIFVHGDLVETYDTYNDLNQFINDPSKRNQDEWVSKLTMHFENNSSLLSRIRGDDEKSSYRARLRKNHNNIMSDIFCNDLKVSFEKFVGNKKIITDNVDDLKLVIGHCTQHDISTIEGENGFNETYSKKISEDKIKETFGETIYTGPVNFERTDNRTKIFGITMECQQRLYRVDVGLSRGFDDGYFYPNFPLSLENENRFLYSKTPQILEINTDGTINIIKSKMRNTRIHLPRPEYERKASEIPELNLYTKDHNYYEQKYLKYKNKYLQLKQIIN